MSHRLIRVAAVVVAAAMLGAAVGCEEHVVREEYAPMTGLSPDMNYRSKSSEIHRPSAEREPRKSNLFNDAVDTLGDAIDKLLGEDDGEATAAGPVERRYDPMWRQ